MLQYGMDFQAHIDIVSKDANSLSIFGLILFSDEHANIVKVLGDEDYWLALNEISGEAVGIFSVKPSRRDQKKRIRQINDAAKRKSGDGPFVLNYLTSLGSDPYETLELVKAFHLSHTSPPRLVVFARLPDDSIAQCDISLSDESTDEAYARLRKLMELVAMSASRITVNNRANTKGVVEAFACEFREYECREKLISTVSWIPFLKEVVEYIK
jgi:hypothetical protein